MQTPSRFHAYSRSAKTPAAPASAPAATRPVATAPPVDDAAEPPAVPEPPDPEPPEPEPDAELVELMREVLLPPTETVYVWLLKVRVVTPSPRAGREAAAGCEVTAGGRPGCEVTTAGWPVTTPLELVWVRYWVLGLLGTATDTEAEAAES